MSLLRLLSAGKSLVGLKEGPARYRMSDPGVMPRFGSGRNPFRKGNAAAAEPAAVAQPVMPAQPAMPATTAPEEAPKPAPKAEPVSVVAPIAPKPAAAAKAESRLKQWLGGLGQKVRRLFRRRPREPKLVTAGRSSRGPVQGELSLDMVRVVRNDLSDSDFEVVTRRPAPAAVSPATALAPEPRAAGPVEGARSRMATRLFCAGKT